MIILWIGFPKEIPVELTECFLSFVITGKCRRSIQSDDAFCFIIDKKLVAFS